ncbi:MAG: hypothetical protein ACD_79C00246G0003 [uncultured bacterium]|nr:MAG: hypothetical protein ACD_79C00246G0003 [uncultured bacterium]
MNTHDNIEAVYTNNKLVGFKTADGKFLAGMKDTTGKFKYSEIIAPEKSKDIKYTLDSKGNTVLTYKTEENEYEIKSGVTHMAKTFAMLVDENGELHKGIEIVPGATNLQLSLDGIVTGKDSTGMEFSYHKDSQLIIKQGSRTVYKEVINKDTGKLETITETVEKPARFSGSFTRTTETETGIIVETSYNSNNNCIAEDKYIKDGNDYVWSQTVYIDLIKGVDITVSANSTQMYAFINGNINFDKININVIKGFGIDGERLTALKIDEEGNKVRYYTQENEGVWTESKQLPVGTVPQMFAGIVTSFLNENESNKTCYDIQGTMIFNKNKTTGTEHFFDEAGKLAMAVPGDSNIILLGVGFDQLDATSQQNYAKYLSYSENGIMHELAGKIEAYSGAYLTKTKDGNFVFNIHGNDEKLEFNGELQVKKTDRYGETYYRPLDLELKDMIKNGDISNNQVKALADYLLKGFRSGELKLDKVNFDAPDAMSYSGESSKFQVTDQLKNFNVFSAIFKDNPEVAEYLATRDPRVKEVMNYNKTLDANICKQDMFGHFSEEIDSSTSKRLYLAIQPIKEISNEAIKENFIKGAYNYLKETKLSDVANVLIFKEQNKDKLMTSDEAAFRNELYGKYLKAQSLIENGVVKWDDLNMNNVEGIFKYYSGIYNDVIRNINNYIDNKAQNNEYYYTNDDIVKYLYDRLPVAIMKNDFNRLKYFENSPAAIYAQAELFDYMVDGKLNPNDKEIQSGIIKEFLPSILNYWQMSSEQIPTEGKNFIPSIQMELAKKEIYKATEKTLREGSMKQMFDDYLGKPQTEIDKINKSSFEAFKNIKFDAKTLFVKLVPLISDYYSTKDKMEKLENTPFAMEETIIKLQALEASKLFVKKAGGGAAIDSAVYYATKGKSLNLLGEFAVNIVKCVADVTINGEISKIQQRVYEANIPVAMETLGVTPDQVIHATEFDYWKKKYMAQRLTYRYDQIKTNNVQITQERIEAVAYEESINMMYDYFNDREKFYDNYLEAINYNKHKD